MVSSTSGDQDDIAFVINGMWWVKLAHILAGQHAVVLAAMAEFVIIYCFVTLFTACKR